ncbi:Acetyltransferase (GNAT) family protein [Micromonospora coriariae]|uniref:Acetyltransferase (GNAT) family protein n=1 Tax=Micromonospora coriariae TaxID=285665 RepID=A0A1C4UQ27_9ACTN|nr:GNAT family N-acetyltransferase [Micromonospora coriariae]SCE73780.1 Acetyltransferase (GNAT) family protein [Micromonospora coriariae]
MIEMTVLAPDDWHTWRELRLAALAEAPDAFGSRLADWQGDGDREERWRGRLSIPGSHNLVASLNGRPVGMASGVPTPDPLVAELISMWVHPEARGHKVGHQLVEAVADWARAGGADRLRLSVMPDNAAAKALYRRTGFSRTDELGDLLPDGVRREQVMLRPL